MNTNLPNIKSILKNMLRIVLVLFSFLFFINSANATWVVKELSDNQIAAYVKGENKPFTGTEIGLYEDRSKWKTPYKNGLKHGVRVITYEKVIKHITFKHGIQHGLYLMEDREDGTIILEHLYENGKKIRTIK